MYEVNQDGAVEYICSVMADASPWSLAFDSSYRLWVCQPNESNPILCFNWNEINKSVSNLF